MLGNYCMYISINTDNLVIKRESSSGEKCKCDQCKLFCQERQKSRTCVCTMEEVL